MDIVHMANGGMMMLEFIVPFTDKAAAEKFDRYHGTNGELVRCRDCKYFEVKDLWADFGKVPILVSDVPTCHKWGEGECKTSPDGYCFLGERRESE